MRYEVYGKWSDPIKEAGRVVRRARTPLLVVEAVSSEEATREAERGGVLVEEVVLEMERAVKEGARERLRQVIDESLRSPEESGLLRRLPGFISADLHSAPGDAGDWHDYYTQCLCYRRVLVWG